MSFLIDLLLIPPILYLIARIFYPNLPQHVVGTSHEAYHWKPAVHPDVMVYKKYTPKELQQFIGPRILLAIQRVGGERTVFDVTAGGTFYGPDGVYGNFAGRDASRGMAKQSFETGRLSSFEQTLMTDMLTDVNDPLDTLEDLTPSEMWVFIVEDELTPSDNMKGWHEHFERKYIVCGELVHAS